MNQHLESLLNDVLEIKTALNDIKAFLMNTEAKPMPRKPLKTAINDSLFLNATNKLQKPTDLYNFSKFDFTKIEYHEGSLITFSELYDACCLDKSVPLNVASRLFKNSPFFKNNNISKFRTAKYRGFTNIRLRLDTSEQQL